ncbi:MAG: FtsX-like permease family protein [Oscillospiraceae bacterium]|nr:FtsX-like permease family protein [Oscillospiraceae bacterium]
MKKTQRKDALRTIRRQFVSYLSIIVIAGLAVNSYLGLSYSADALRKNLSAFYDELNYCDLKVFSNTLLTPDDLEAIRNTEGVAAAEPFLQTAAKLQEETTGLEVSVYSLTENISRVKLVKGRMPQTAGECVMENRAAEHMGYIIGSRLSLCTAGGETAPLLTQPDFTVTGIIQYPDNVTPQMSVSYYVLVPPEAFDEEQLDGAWTGIFVQATEGRREWFSEGYLTEVKTVEDRLNALAEPREETRDREIREDAEQKIRDAEQDLAEAKEKIEDGKAELRDARRELDDGWAELEEQQAKIPDGQKSLDRMEASLNDGKTKLDQGEELLQQMQEQLEQKLEQQLKLIAGMPGLNVNALREKLYEESGYNEYRRQYQAALKQYEDSRNTFYYLGEEYLDKLTELDNARKKLEQAEADYREALDELIDGMIEYRDGCRELEEAKQSLADLKETRWKVMDCKSNQSYLGAEQETNSLTEISRSFSMVFILVGAMVIYAAVGRLVEEDSRIIGTMKALGMKNREIMNKYYLFAVSATLFGLVSGILVAYFLLQRIILRLFRGFFFAEQKYLVFLPVNTAVVLAAGVLLAFVAARLACTRLLKAEAVALVNGLNTNSGPQKAVRRGRRSGRRLYSRMILLNMRTDIKRVAVSVVCIMGCCTLMTVGFSLKFDIDRTCPVEYERITHYGRRIFFDPERSETAEAELGKILTEEGLHYISGRYEEKVPIEANDFYSIGVIICLDQEDAALAYSFYDPDTRKPIALPKHGLLVMQHFTDEYGVGPGDPLTLYDKRMAATEATLGGTYENYVENLVFVSREAYREIYGTDAENNTLFLIEDVEEIDELEDRFKEVEGFSSVFSSDGKRETVQKLSYMADGIIVILSVSAVMMAFFVQLNLAESYVLKKKREMTVMRINGFTVKEVRRYIEYEVYVITGVGIILGMELGAFLGSRFILLLELPMLHYVKDPYWLTFVLAAAATGLISLMIHSIAFRKIRDLKLTDIT